MEPGRGRFWNQDDYEGSTNEPATLHKYLYCASDPVNRLDVDGNDFDIASVGSEVGVVGTTASIAVVVPPKIVGGTQIKWHGYTVLIVNEPADFAVIGPLAARLGKYHQWLAVYNNGILVKAAGLGNDKGVPGANGQNSPDVPYISHGYVDDHGDRMHDVGISTSPVFGVDATAVLAYLNLSQTHYDTGQWSLGENDCNTWVRMVIDRSTPQWVETPQFKSPTSPYIPTGHEVVILPDDTIREPIAITTFGNQ
jgi:hypothetical protein